MNASLVPMRNHCRQGGEAPNWSAQAAPASSAVDDGDNIAAFSALVGDVYDAAVDPRRWPGVLRKARDFTGGAAAALFSKDASIKSLNVHYDCGGVDHRYTQLYIDTYARFDPMTTAHVLAEIEQPICTGDVIPYDEFYQTRIYKEWVQPQGLIDFISAVLDRSATGAALFGVFRSEAQGIVDEAMRRRVRQLVPHIRRAVLIGRVIELKTVEAATLADTLDGLSAAMFLIDANGRIAHANASGHAMLADGGVLRAAQGRLFAGNAASADTLQDIFAAAAAGDAAVGTKGIALALPGPDGATYSAHVLPLTSGSRRHAGVSYAAVAAVFVRKAELDLPAPPMALAKRYNLTPSELRVLLAVIQVGGVAETAEALGIGEATVKTHLHRLFAKTGSTRQADLVKLVAGYSNPLVN